MLLQDIYVHPSTDLLGREVMEALSQVAPVRFVNCPKLAERNRNDVVLSLSGEEQALAEISKLGLRGFHVTNKNPGARSEAMGEAVRFGKSDHVDKLFRRRTIPHQAVANLTPVGLQANDEVLARYGEQPFWVRRQLANSAAHVVSAPLPKLVDEERPFDYLNGYNFVQLLPLLHFLREVTVGMGWTRPPLRACFTFDDPNLHWSSYGFLSYRELIERAKQDRFHVAFATVPLDAWGSNGATVDLFKENPGQISLLVHGNNHTREELGQARTPEGHLQLLAQSLRRVEKLERATGLQVDRVMVPPHEALVDGALTALLSLGFEGVSLTPWSLRYWNPKREWPCAFGLDSAELIDGGCPMLSRYKLTNACDGPIVMSAYLGAPIVLIEHHEAVSGGLDLLTRAASVINSLGDVQWCSTGQMMRSNYLTRRENGTLWVKPVSARVEFKVPQDISSIALATKDAGDPDFLIVPKRRGVKSAEIPAAAGVPFRVGPGETVELVSSKLGKVDHRQVETADLQIAALSRRLLCETRDRLAALKPRPRRA